MLNSCASNVVVVNIDNRLGAGYVASLINRLCPRYLLPICLRAQDMFQVHGYVQGRFTNQEGTPDRLEIRRARLIFVRRSAFAAVLQVQVDLVKCQRANSQRM
jgi:hypothetical protein